MLASRRLSLVCALLLCTEAAHADPIPQQRRTWYGGQILLVDGVSLLAWKPEVSLWGYALGGPVIHMVHQRPRIAFASLAVRVALPTFVVASGCEDTGFVFGCRHVLESFLAGAAAAVAIDASLFARSDPETYYPPDTSVSFRLDPQRRAAQATAGGRF